MSTITLTVFTCSYNDSSFFCPESEIILHVHDVGHSRPLLVKMNERNSKNVIFFCHVRAVGKTSYKYSVFHGNGLSCYPVVFFCVFFP